MSPPSPPPPLTIPTSKPSRTLIHLFSCLITLLLLCNCAFIFKVKASESLLGDESATFQRASVRSPDASQQQRHLPRLRELNRSNRRNNILLASYFGDGQLWREHWALERQDGFGGRRIIHNHQGNEFQYFSQRNTASADTATTPGQFAYSIGNGENGELGISKEDLTASIPIEIPKSGPMLGKSIVSVAAGGYFTLFLDDEHQVYATGDNDSGELGDSTDSQRFVPVQVPTQGPMLQSKIFRISAGEQHSLFLDDKGVPYASGTNQFGNLCAPKHVGNQKVPQSINMSSPIIDISAGEQHSFFLTSQGQVLVCGDNSENQAGTDQANHIYNPLPVPPHGDMWNKKISVASAGYFHSLFVDVSGQAYAVGSNAYWQLGNDTNERALVPIAIPPRGDMYGVPVDQVLACSQYSLFLDKNGSVYFAGRADHGAGGIFSRNDIRIPTRVYFHSTDRIFVQHMACGWDYSLFLDTRGRVYATGNNNNNVLGYFFSSPQTHNPLETMLNVSIIAAGPGFSIFVGERPCSSAHHLTRDALCVPCTQTLKCSECHIEDKGLYSCTPCSKGYTCSNNDADEPKDPQKSPFLSFSEILAIFAVIFGPSVASLVVCLFCVCGCIAISVPYCHRIRNRMHKEARRAHLAQHLLQSYMNDYELDVLDEDLTRARLIVRENMLEVDFDEITFEDKIGTGGSGAHVFKGQWQGQEVAVKLFRHFGLATNGDRFFEEFEKEVSFMSSLRHPRIIQFYGCSLRPPRVGLLMEYCPESLASLIRSGRMRELSAEHRLRYLMEVCEGMQLLHSKRIVHRDLKCDNVLLSEKDEVRVADFGLSRDFISQSQSGAMTKQVGTFRYMAPEIILHNRYNERCDVFSFSILCWEVCIGRMNPFEGSNEGQVPYLMANNPSFRPDLERAEFAQGGAFEFMHGLLMECWDELPENRPSFEQIRERIEKRGR